MITGIEYIKMSKHDIYEEYCKIYKQYEMVVEREINRLKAESNNLKGELLLSYIQNPIKPVNPFQDDGSLKEDIERAMLDGLRSTAPDRPDFLKKKKI